MKIPPGWHPISEQVRQRVLSPYLEGCDYVKRASWCGSADNHSAQLAAELSIARSCYIEETGHFNAVEANIAFNQMFYLLAASAVERGRLAGFEGMTLDEWLERQLPHVLIKDYEFHFKHVIDRTAFEGAMEFATVIPKERFVVFDVICRFWDGMGGLAEGRSCVMFDNRHLAAPKANEGHA